MRLRLAPLVLLLAAGFAAAADPPSPPQVRWPKVAAPSPAPSAVSKLSPDRWFIVDSDVELIMLDSPPGRVSKSVETGPFKVKGKFADGGDDVEVRTYTGKFIYFLEVKKGAAAGPIELLTAKRGPDLKEADFERRNFDVQGEEVKPPPGPGPGPEPTDPLFKPLKAAWEKGKDPPALAKLLKVYTAAAATDLAAFPTAGTLYAALKDKVKENGLAEGDLRAVREAIQVELANFLPSDPDARLTQDHRANAKSTFRRIITCLEGLK